MSETRTNRKTSEGRCFACNAEVSEGMSFRFNSSECGGDILKCFRCGLHHTPILKRSFRVALVVGTLLTLLNQGDALIMGRVNDSLMWKIPLTYCVPFVVATYGALSSNRTK